MRSASTSAKAAHSQTLQATGGGLVQKHYICQLCGIECNNAKDFRRHRSGKSHRERLAATQADVGAAVTATDTAVQGAGFGSNELRWHTDMRQLEGFPMDHTILSPSTMVAALDEEQRALLRAYIASRNPHSPELMDVLEHIVRKEPTHLRLKELFESMEACRKIATFVVDLQKEGASLTTIYDLASGHGLVGILLAYRFPRLRVVCADRTRRAAFDTALAAFEACGDPPPPPRAAKPKTSVGLPFGHGVALKHDSVGGSAASISAGAGCGDNGNGNGNGKGNGKGNDKGNGKGNGKGRARRGGGTARPHPRPIADPSATLLMPAPTGSASSCSSDASTQLGGASTAGSPPAPPKSVVLPNVSFVEGDFAALGALPRGSFVVSIHACNEANRLAINMAKAANAAWAVMPCCIRDDLVPVASVRLRDDEEKYIVKCGIIAGSTNASKVTSIDKRITNRHIMLMGCAS